MRFQIVVALAVFVVIAATPTLEETAYCNRECNTVQSDSLRSLCTHYRVYKPEGVVRPRCCWHCGRARPHMSLTLP